MSLSFSRHLLLALALFCSLLVVSCDTTVDAIIENPEYKYSMYGILDANRDTQWIRVENLRDGVAIGAPDTLDVTVRLTDETERTSSVLRDSLFQDASALDAQFHNFWTTMSIQPDHSYRVEVVQDGRVEATATTTTPDSAFSYYTRRGRTNSFSLFVTSETPLAGASAIFDGTANDEPGCSGLPPTQIELDLYADTDTPSEGVYRIPLRQPSETTLQNYDCFDFDLETFKIRTADGGPDWPGFSEYHRLPLEATVNPDSFSNVDGGHGYVAGVLRRTYVIRLENGAATVLAVY